MINASLITLTTPALDGGIGRNIVNLTEAFHNFGCRVHLLIDKPKGPYLDLLHPAVKIFHLSTSHPISGILAMSKYLLQHKPDVILTPNVRHTALALRARRFVSHSTQIHVNVHNTYSKTFQNLSAQKRRKRIKKISALYPRCNGIIPVSNGVAEDLCSLTKLPQETLTTIYNPVVTRKLDELAAEPVEHPWFADNKRPIILGVSRIEKTKNLPLLVGAFEQVRQQLPCRLMLVGDGTQYATIETRTQASPFCEDITLVGHQNNPYNYMKNASLFVLSSSWEGFGNSLVEAMATGTPVVSTDCPNGPREILDNGRYGPLVPVDDETALARAMLKTLHSPLPAAILKQGVERFRDTVIARQYLQAFDLLSPSRADTN